MKKQLSILAGVSVSAVASIAMASHPPTFAYDYARIRDTAEVIVRKAQAILDADAAREAQVRGGWIYHHVHGWRRHPVHGAAIDPHWRRYREQALSAMTRLAKNAQHFAQQVRSRTALNHIRQDFRRLERSLTLARRVFGWLRPTAGMRSDMNELADLVAGIAPSVQRMTLPGLYRPVTAIPPSTPAPVIYEYRPQPLPTTVYTAPVSGVTPVVSWYQTN